MNQDKILHDLNESIKLLTDAVINLQAAFEAEFDESETYEATGVFIGLPYREYKTRLELAVDNTVDKKDT